MSSSDHTPDLKARIQKVLTEEIGPALNLDGVEVLDLRDGVLQIRLCGACNGCPGTVMAVIMGMEEEVRRRFPEIEYLEASAWHDLERSGPCLFSVTTSPPMIG